MKNDYEAFDSKVVRGLRVMNEFKREIIGDSGVFPQLLQVSYLVIS